MIAVALAIAPKSVKRAYADWCDPDVGPAQCRLSEIVTDAVAEYLAVKSRTDDRRGFMARLP